ncbi:MAG: HEAT repeat domain-containing protein [Pirellulaceae bacterium]|nr:HEAT repeat domain-containing protein [Pirellulaceae bacterium]
MRILQLFCLLTWILSISTSAWCQQPDYSDELPRIPPTSPDQALATFEVAEGFEIQLIASEPLVASPVAIEWDASGGLFVCEMRGYSEDRDDGLSRIARLTDTNGDGVYDTRTDFAEGLFWPTALFPYDGGLFVADAPNLWYFKDSDGDGRADVKQHVLSGFGTSNVQGLVNSFRWGLDNRIHIACSSVGGEIRHAHQDESVPSLNIRGRDLALNPRTYEIEPTAGAAQHGMSFDDWGHKFASSNSDHIQQVMYEDRMIARNPYMIPPPSRISIAADGPAAEVYRTSPVEPWRIVRTRLRVSGEVKGVIEGGGRAAGYFTGATGVTIYRGDAWPSSYKGVAIIGDVGSNLIHRKRLVPNGLEFIAQRMDDHSEFVTSTDIWFRPAQFANAPNGALAVIDMYREVIEHPASLPPQIKMHLDLTSGRDAGRIYQVVPSGFRSSGPIDLSGRSTLELVALLAHENAWHRETAARLLYERQDPAAIEPLKQLVRNSSSALGRMHALYALSGLRKLDEATILVALADTHAQVRRHAVRLAGPMEWTPELSAALGDLVDDESMEVRYQLAFALGDGPAPQRTERLLRVLARDPADRWMRAAVMSSIGEDVEHLNEVVDDPEFSKQIAEQVAARQRAKDAPRDAGSTHTISPPTSPRTAEQAALREKIIAQYRVSLSMPADIDRGREVFKKSCSACHRVQGVGHELGPSLMAIKSRGAETLLASILDPNSEVNPQYVNYLVVTLEGRVISGMIVDEGATSITLKKDEGVTETVLRVDIDQIKNTGLSLMPQGLEETLDKQAIADLIAYLMAE